MVEPTPSEADDAVNWSSLFAFAWRAVIALFAALGVEAAIGIPFIIGVVFLLALLLLELALGSWFRRHPLGTIRPVFALVMLQLSQPLVWVLAAVGILAV